MAQALPGTAGTVVVRTITLKLLRVWPWRPRRSDGTGYAGSEYRG